MYRVQGKATSCRDTQKPGHRSDLRGATNSKANRALRAQETSRLQEPGHSNSGLATVKLQ